MLRASGVYETEPRDVPNQAWFLNQVVEAETELFPIQLLGRLQKIERALGRLPGLPKGPRAIDLDILLYGDAIVSVPDLDIPHPRMGDRRFVLEPLAELAPDLRLKLPSRTRPPDTRTVREMLAGVADQEVRRITPQPRIRLIN